MLKHTRTTKSRKRQTSRLKSEVLEHRWLLATHVLDFNNLAYNQTLGSSVTEEGFLVRGIAGNLSTWRTDWAVAQGTTVFQTSAGAQIRVSREDGGTFRFISIDLNSLNGNQPSYVQFTGKQPSGDLSNFSQTTDSNFSTFQSFASSNSNPLVELIWSQVDPGGPSTDFHQFDNIVVEVGASVVGFGQPDSSVDYTPVTSLEVTFNEEVDLSTFTFEDISLTRNGQTVTLDNSVTISQVSGSTYRIEGLANFTSTLGDYNLSVHALNILSPSGLQGVGTEGLSWSYVAPLTVVAIPFVQEAPEVPHPVHEQGNITLKAIARGANSSGDYEIWWDTDFDGNFDNNPSRIVNATAGTNTIYDIGQTFTVPNVDFDQQLDVQVRIRELDSGEEAFGTFHIYVNDFRPSNDPRSWTSEQLEVIQQMSVQESMWYVHRNMTRSGNLTSTMTGNYAYDVTSPQAVKLLLANGHLPAYAPGSFNNFGQGIPQGFTTVNDTRWESDPYAETAQRLLNGIITRASLVTIPSADEGNRSGFLPNGTAITVNRIPGTTDSRGVSLTHPSQLPAANDVGEHASALSAIALALPALGGTPVQIGSQAGQSWEWLVQQAVDWLGYAQIDGDTGVGSWHYNMAVNGSATESSADADVFAWVIAGLSDAETLGSPYGIIVDNLHKYRIANAIINQQASNYLAGWRGTDTAGSLGMTAGYIEAARWLGIQYFSQGDGTVAFPGIASISRGQLRLAYDRYQSAAASVWTQANRVGPSFAWFDSLWGSGDYLQGNINALYNAGTNGEPLHIYRYANAFREGQPEITNFANHDWNREFTTFLTRAQERHVNSNDPWQYYSNFGSVSTSVAVTSWTQNFGSPQYGAVLAGLTMSPTVIHPPKYGSIQLPSEAYVGQSLSFSLEPAPNFASIQWDFDASNGLSWDFGAPIDATGQSVNYTFAGQGNYQITVRGLYSDGTIYTYTRTLSVLPNNAPVANDDSISTDQDTAVMFNVLVDNGAGTDQDIDGNLVPSQTTLLTSPAQGIVTQHANGNFTFDPNGQFDYLPAGQSTTVSFDYQIEDEAGSTATATVTITINGTNETAIIAGTLTGTTAEDTATEVTGIATVSDIDTGENAFVPQAATVDTYGTFTIDASGNWSFTPDTAAVQYLSVGEQMDASYVITTTDGTQATVTITIHGINDLPSLSINSVSSFRYVGSSIQVSASASDVDGDNNSIIFNYLIYIDDSPTPAFTGNGLPPTSFLFLPNVAGEYRVELTAIDDDNGETTTQTTFTVGAPSQVSFLFAGDASVPGDVNNSGPGTEALFHEWQDAAGQLWFTIHSDVPNTPFDLTFQLNSTKPWLTEPQLTASLASSSSWVHQQNNDTLSTTGTLHGLDLSGYQVGDQVLLATITYPTDRTNAAGILMDHSGEYVSATNDHGVQLASARVSPSNQPFAVEQHVPGQFMPVIYDANDDGKIGIADFAQFISQYGRTPNENYPDAYRFDYNQDGRVGIADFSFFIRNYGRKKENPSATILFPEITPAPQTMAFPLEAEPLASPELSLFAEPFLPIETHEFAWLPPLASFESPTATRPTETTPDESSLTSDLEATLPNPTDHSDFDPKVIDAIYQNEFANPADPTSTEEDADLYQLLTNQ